MNSSLTYLSQGMEDGKKIPDEELQCVQCLIAVNDMGRERQMGPGS